MNKKEEVKKSTITMEQYIGWMKNVKSNLEKAEPQDSKVNKSAILALKSCIELANKVEIPVEVTKDVEDPYMEWRDMRDVVYDEFHKEDE